MKTLKCFICLATILVFLASDAFAQRPFVHTTTSSNITRHMTTLNHSSVNGKPNKLLFITQHYGKYNDHQAGVWYSRGKWIIYNEDRKTMPQKTKFNVLAVNPSGKAFMHKAKSGNISRNWTTIDHPKCNGNPNAVLLVTQNWKGTYNPKAIGVWYTGRRWAIYNQDLSPMPEGANFNVMVLREGTSNNLGNSTVCIHKATSSNKKNAWGPYLSLTQMKTSSACMFITQNWKASGPYNDHIPAVWFGGREWTIYNQDKQELPNNAKFNVLAFGL